jgi:predicted dehydrogenase
MMDIGVHWMDLAEYVTGQRIVEIAAFFTTHYPSRIWTGQPGQGPEPAGRKVSAGVEIDVKVEEHAELLVRFDAGTSGSASICTMSAGYPNRLMLSLDGMNLGIDWVQQEPDWYLERRRDGLMKKFRNPAEFRNAGSGVTFLPPGHAEGHGEAFRYVMARCWKAMRGEDVAYPTFHDGLRSLALVDAAIRSNADGLATQLDADCSLKYRRAASGTGGQQPLSAARSRGLLAPAIFGRCKGRWEAPRAIDQEGPAARRVPVTARVSSLTA